MLHELAQALLHAFYRLAGLVVVAAPSREALDDIEEACLLEAESHGREQEIEMPREARPVENLNQHLLTGP